MVGRKAAISSEEILEKLKEFEIYENNELIARKDKLWKEVCASLNNLINPVNLYNFVRQDRHNILTYYKIHKGLREQIIDKNDHEIDDLDLSNIDEDVQVTPRKRKISSKEDKDYNDCSGTDEVEVPKKKKKLINKCNKNKITFDIVVPSDEWCAIRPIEKVYVSGCKAESLQEGRTDTVRKLIWDCKKLPCAYSFDRHTVGDNYNAYIKIDGHCTECESQINLVCDKPVLDEPVMFTVSTIDARAIPHSKKIRLQKSAKTKVEKEVIHTLPKQWRRDNARIEMNDDDPEPAHLYKLSQLQNARQDAKNKKLGIKRGINLFDSLTEIKNSCEFNKFIREIGYDKFHLMYWSPQQISINNDILNKLDNPVSLDATASITLKVKRPGGDSSDVYLSVMVTHINNMIVPLTQAMSDKNDTCFYTYWLQTWIQSGAHKPRTITTDMGKAIQIGACLAFNTMTFDAYNDLCLEILLGKRTSVDIPTQMRTDIAHVEHAVTRWPCFSTANSKVKLLYIKSVGFMTTIENLEQFVECLQCVFIVAYSKVNNESCQKAINYLVARIESFNFDANISKIHELKDNVYDPTALTEENPDQKCKLTYIFIENIKKDVLTVVNKEKDSVGTHSNDYHLPDFANRFVNLCKEFVCWSSVMNKYFNNSDAVATSARSEAYFGELKLALESIMREDKLFVMHARNIDADMKLARAALNNLKKEQCVTREPRVNSSAEHLHAVERWKNKYSKMEHEDFLNNFTIVSENNETDNCFDNKTVEPFQEEIVRGEILQEVVVREEIVQEEIVYTSESMYTSNQKDVKEDISLADHDYTHFRNGMELHSSSLQSNEKCTAQDLLVNQCISNPTKKNQEKQRGIHVRPDKEIRLRLQRPDSKGAKDKKRNIQNGNKQPEKAMKGKKLSFTNTCGFDSITEILSIACCNITDFRNFIENSVHDQKAKKYLCYASTVIKHSISGTNTVLYTNRAHLLYSLFNVVVDTSVINCEVNVTRLFELLMNPYDCTMLVRYCSLCQHREENKVLTIPLPDLKIVWSHQYRNFEQEINN